MSNYSAAVTGTGETVSANVFADGSFIGSVRLRKDADGALKIWGSNILDWGSADLAGYLYDGVDSDDLIVEQVDAEIDEIICAVERASAE